MHVVHVYEAPQLPELSNTYTEQDWYRDTSDVMKNIYYIQKTYYIQKNSLNHDVNEPPLTETHKGAGYSASRLQVQYKLLFIFSS